MGPGPFEAAVTDVLGSSEATTLLAALTASSRGPASGSARGIRGTAGRGGGVSEVGGRGARPRPSIREQMMAARRKQEEGRQAVAAAGVAAAGAGGGGAEGLPQGEASAPAVNVAGSEVDGFVMLT